MPPSGTRVLGMTLRLPPLRLVVAVLSGLSGVAGVILGAVNAGGLTAPVQGIITAIGGLLAAIAAHHASAAAAGRAKAVS